jgi:heat shock protein HtpX
MFDAVASNKAKSVLLILLVVAFLVAMGYVFGRLTALGPYGVPLALIIASISIIGSYYYSDQIVLTMSHARPVEHADNPHLYNTVEGLAIAAQVPMPHIYVIDDPAPNAFATGRNPQHAALAVTTGLLEKLDNQELEGVIGHEMSHIKDYDVLFMMLVAVLVGTVALLADWLLRYMWWGGSTRRRSDRDSSGGGAGWIALIGLVLAILAPLAATLIQLAVSRRREYLADAEGAVLTRYPDGLADALEKIAADPEPLHSANKATAHLFIYNPLVEHGGWLNSLFSTHPPMEERIRRLRAM